MGYPLVVEPGLLPPRLQLPGRRAALVAPLASFQTSQSLQGWKSPRELRVVTTRCVDRSVWDADCGAQRAKTGPTGLSPAQRPNNFNQSGGAAAGIARYHDCPRCCEGSVMRAIASRKRSHSTRQPRNRGEPRPVFGTFGPPRGRRRGARLPRRGQREPLAHTADVTDVGAPVICPSNAMGSGISLGLPEARGGPGRSRDHLLRRVVRRGHQALLLEGVLHLLTCLLEVAGSLVALTLRLQGAVISGLAPASFTCPFVRPGTLSFACPSQTCDPLFLFVCQLKQYPVHGSKMPPNGRSRAIPDPKPMTPRRSRRISRTGSLGDTCHEHEGQNPLQRGSSRAAIEPRRTPEPERNRVDIVLDAAVGRCPKDTVVTCVCARGKEAIPLLATIGDHFSDLSFDVTSLGVSPRSDR